MRKSTGYLLLTAILMGGLGIALAFPQLSAPREATRVGREKAFVKKMGLTDICLFTEARYTRHLTQTDRHAAFQDAPMAWEHFPSGSLTVPPPVLIVGSDRSAAMLKLVPDGRHNSLSKSVLTLSK